MSIPTISIVIPTYNKTDLLQDCLRSIKQQTCTPDEVIVVDDASTEIIAGAVSEIFPAARVLRLENNSGFCVAINTGIRAAAGSHVFLLNNDMTLEPDCLERLVFVATLAPTAIVTPFVRFQAEPGIVFAAGDALLRNGRPVSIGFRKSCAGFQARSDVFGATGGAMLVPRDVFNTVGLFDERFVAYFEDADFSARARLAGYSCVLAADAFAKHVGSASLAGKTWWRSRQCFRNHALLVIKNFPASVLLRNFPVIVVERIHQARRVFSSARTEFGALHALVVLAGAALSLAAAIPHAVRERYRIQRTRRIGAAAFHALLSRESELP